METVNDFKVLEVDCKLCKLEFDEEPKIKASLSFWYLTGEEDEWPLVGEFSFDYDVLDSEADREKLEVYPHRVVEGRMAYSMRAKTRGLAEFQYYY